MATIKGPLFSLDASGTIGETVVFSKWKGRNYVRRHVIPSNPQSDLQRAMRAVLQFITQDWTNLTTTVKGKWKDEADPFSITPLNAMVKDAGARARNGQGWRQSPDAASSATPEAVTLGTPVPARNSITLPFTSGASTPGQYTSFALVDSSSFTTYDISRLRKIVTVSESPIVIPNLKPGTTYYVTVAENNFDGEIGSIATPISIATLT